MTLELVLLGQLVITAYRSVPAQTDDTPYYTSIGEHTHPGGCAASRDLLGSSVHYGDYVYIEDIGLCKINDTMHPRMKQHIDLWVESKAQEKHVGTRHKRVWRVKLPPPRIKI